MAIKLAQAFETTPDFWLNAQQAVDIWLSSSRKKRKIPSLIKRKVRRKHRYVAA